MEVAAATIACVLGSRPEQHGRTFSTTAFPKDQWNSKGRAPCRATRNKNIVKETNDRTGRSRTTPRYPNERKNETTAADYAHGKILDFEDLQIIIYSGLTQVNAMLPCELYTRICSCERTHICEQVPVPSEKTFGVGQ